MKTPEEVLLARFPKSQEAIKIDASARAFYMLLLRGDDPYVVIDEMLFHYTNVKNDLQEQLKRYATP